MRRIPLASKAFVEAVAAVHDWAVDNDATVRFTRAVDIDGMDGRRWTSFMVDTKGTAPGRVSSERPEAVDAIMAEMDPFDFTVGA